MRIHRRQFGWVDSAPDRFATVIYCRLLPHPQVVAALFANEAAAISRVIAQLPQIQSTEPQGPIWLQISDEKASSSKKWPKNRSLEGECDNQPASERPCLTSERPPPD